MSEKKESDFSTITDYYEYGTEHYQSGRNQWFTDGAYVLNVDISKSQEFLNAYHGFLKNNRVIVNQPSLPTRPQVPLDHQNTESESAFDQQSVSFIEEPTSAKIVSDSTLVLKFQNQSFCESKTLKRYLVDTEPNEAPKFNYFMSAVQYDIVQNNWLNQKQNVFQEDFDYSNNFGYSGTPAVLGYNNNFSLQFAVNICFENVGDKENVGYSWSVISGILFKCTSTGRMSEAYFVEKIFDRVKSIFGTVVAFDLRLLLSPHSIHAYRNKVRNHSFTDFCSKSRYGYMTTMLNMGLLGCKFGHTQQKQFFSLPSAVKNQIGKCVIDNYAKLTELIALIDSVTFEKHLVVCVGSESSMYDGVDKKTDKFCIVLQIAFYIDGVAHFYLIDLQSLGYEWKLLKCFYAVVFENTNVTVIGQSIEDGDMVETFIQKTEVFAVNNNFISHRTVPNIHSPVEKPKRKVLRMDEILLFVASKCSQYLCQCKEDVCANAFKLTFGHSENPVGLAEMCKDILGFSVNKSEQLSDWAQRPLTRPQIVYGITDCYVLSLMFTKASMWYKEAFGLNFTDIVRTVCIA